MSGIYIPIKGKVKDGTFCQVIVVDGVPKVFTFGRNNIHLEHLTDGIIVPDHGRLIDADAMRESLADLMKFPSNLVNGQWIVNTIREQPTIIPADKEGEG